MSDDDARNVVTVNDVVPPHCERCDRALSTTAEMNRRIDWALDMCDSCLSEEEADDCICSYGFFVGGDPRRFVPDEEMNTPEELARHRAACEAWDRGERGAPPAEEHGPWTDKETGVVTIGERPPGAVVGACHAFRSFGMGSTYCEQHWRAS